MGSLTHCPILSASFDIPTAYPAETIRLRVTYGNVKLALSWDARTPKSFAPKRERCERTNLGPMVWMLSAICGTLLRQRFIVALMLLP